MVMLDHQDPLAVALVQAIRAGDIASLSAILSDNPGHADVSVRDAKGRSRTLLHVATDWPGYFPHGPAIIEFLITAGADPNQPVTGGPHAETPLHWAASSDDLDVAVALIDGGADIEAPGASITGGGPIDDAVGYGCWHVARLLAARGARLSLWQAAALGKLTQVEAMLGAQPAPTPDQLDEAFWQACHGGQRRMADYLVACGANPYAKPGYSDQTPVQIAGSLDTRREALLTWLRDQTPMTTGYNGRL
jgi:ankyrin repeat protein